ncbi:MAG TPA: hypothetical protein VFJ58_02640 [Armatimonadota bacterium]|nr:hypothetical protein [Armatimonadota bacterium]
MRTPKHRRIHPHRRRPAPKPPSDDANGGDGANDGGVIEPASHVRTKPKPTSPAPANVVPYAAPQKGVREWRPRPARLWTWVPIWTILYFFAWFAILGEPISRWLRAIASGALTIWYCWNAVPPLLAIIRPGSVITNASGLKLIGRGQNAEARWGEIRSISLSRVTTELLIDADQRIRIHLAGYPPAEQEELVRFIADHSKLTLRPGSRSEYVRRDAMRAPKPK